MSAPSRRPEIKRRQTRKEKLDKLRRRYTKAASEVERNRIFDKARLVSPQITLEEFAGKPAA